MKKLVLSVFFVLGLINLSFAAAVKPAVSIELNKLSQSKENCITYFIIHNTTQNNFTSLQTELIIFDKSDIINTIILGDFKSIPAGKTLVKRFGIPKTTCSQIGKILINDVRQCNVGKESKNDCLTLLKPSNKSTVQLFK